MITIGENSYMGSFHNDYNGDVNIGKFTSIANGVTFLGHCEHPPKENKEVVSTFNFLERWNIETYPKCSGKPITIGSDVWIGENVLILDGVSIGNGAIIGAGSVVTKDVLDYEVVGGSPARRIKLRFEIKIVLQLLQIKWWDWSDSLIKERLPEMVNIKTFIEKYGRKN